MGIAYYFLIVLIISGVIAALLYMYRHKKEGTCIGCSGCCTSCSRICNKEKGDNKQFW